MGSSAASRYVRWKQVCKAYKRSHDHLLDALHWARPSTNLLLKRRDSR